MSDIRPIRTEADYDRALAEIEQYFENEPDVGTPESDRFEVLATLIEAYEAKYWPIDPPDPVEAIVQTMELKGQTRKDLERVLGSRSRASEILGRRRALTVGMAHKIHQAWGIPAETLIMPYHVERAATKKATPEAAMKKIGQRKQKGRMPKKLRVE